MNIVNQMLLTVLLFSLGVFMLSAMMAPTLFGDWLQKIDEARYEYTMCE
jgi:hypothetical protein